MQLSPHFSLEEMTRTEVRHPNVPGTWERGNLVRLCATVLEPLRDLVGPLIVHSGYRSPHVNSAVGGAVDSAHLYGLAADIVPGNAALSCLDLMHAIRSSPLAAILDQTIYERPGSSAWIHVGLAAPARETRHQMLMCLSRRHYEPFDAARVIA